MVLAPPLLPDIPLGSEVGSESAIQAGPGRSDGVEPVILARRSSLARKQTAEGHHAKPMRSEQKHSPASERFPSWHAGWPAPKGGSAPPVLAAPL